VRTPPPPSRTPAPFERARRIAHAASQVRSPVFSSGRERAAAEMHLRSLTPEEEKEYAERTWREMEDVNAAGEDGPEWYDAPSPEGRW